MAKKQKNHTQLNKTGGKMKMLNAWLVILAGVILLLPLIGVTQLGTVTDGILAWALAIVVIIIGIVKLMRKK